MRLDFTSSLLGVAACVSLSTASADPAKHPHVQVLPPLRDQARLVDGWTEERKALIPGILRKYNVDAWLMSQREYAEDTVFWALKDATQFSARRRTTQLFLANTTAPNHHDQDYSYTWIDNTARVWAELRDVLEAHQPRRIALNTHAELAFSSGLHAGEHNAIMVALGEPWGDRFVLEPMVAVEVVAAMGGETSSRLEWYRRMMETAWAVIGEAFSGAVITPGVSSVEDVEWWLREKVLALNYSTWFQPTVSVMTEDDCSMCEAGSRGGSEPTVIRQGDVIHVDFGVTALGMNTDTQHLGYVLGADEQEEDIPESLVEGLRKANRLQDITRAQMQVGLTGNQILGNIRAQMAREEIEGKIYCHAVGQFGHSAGTVIGMTNLQEAVPFLGDLPLLKDTYYSVELYAEHFVPEKNMTVKFPLEEDVYWSEKTQSWEWVYGRQSRYLFVHSDSKETELEL